MPVWRQSSGPSLFSSSPRRDCFRSTPTWLIRFGPRIVVTLASALVGVGWIGAGLANSLPTLYLAYGLGGIGAGAVYSATIGIAMKWFPDRRGLCVGLVAGSYGFGTALTGIPIEQMIKSSGYQSAFIFWGVVQGIVVLVAAQFLRLPPAGWATGELGGDQGQSAAEGATVIA